MATEYTGNFSPAPTFVTGTQTVDDELLASTVGVRQFGVTLEPGQGVLLLGTALKRDATTKRYKRVTSGQESTATGLLRQTVDTGSVSTAQVWQSNILVSGQVKYDKVVAANSGVTLSSVLSPRIDIPRNWFIF